MRWKADIDSIRALRAEHPDGSRQRLSQHQLQESEREKKENGCYHTRSPSLRPE